MSRGTDKKVGGVVIAAVAPIVFVFWLAAAMNYGDDVAVGKYHFSGSHQKSSLELLPNHTFTQTLEADGAVRRATGTWHRAGEGGISFSNGFLVVTGDEPSPTGESFCEMKKLAGLFVSLHMRQYDVRWYGKKDNGDQVLGDYVDNDSGGKQSLTLNADHTFIQTVAGTTGPKYVNGRWMQDSIGTIQFSGDFLKASGDLLAPDERASSIDPRGTALQIEISKEGRTAEPIFYKRYLTF